MPADARDLARRLFDALAEPFSAQELFDCMPDVVFFIKNAQCQYVVVNQTLVERCGRPSKAHLIGRRADEIFPGALGETYRAQDEEVIRAGHAIRDRLELHFYLTGGCGWCLTNKLPLTDRDGNTVGLVGVSKDLQSANEKGEEFARVANAVARIRGEYDQPLQVTELAAGAGLSVYQFEQRIRRIFHITAGHLIQKVRMEAAVRLLLQSDASIATIASRCGYSDQSAFTRKFRETVGLSPMQYRHAFRETANERARPHTDSTSSVAPRA